MCFQRADILDISLQKICQYTSESGKYLGVYSIYSFLISLQLIP